MADSGQIDPRENDPRRGDPGPTYRQRANAWAERSPWSNVVVLGTIVVAVFLIFYFRPFGGHDPENDRAVGQKLPLVELRRLTGNSSSITRADLENRVVLISFWGPWCPPCRKELPYVAEIGKKFSGDSAFKLLPVSCGPPGQAEDLHSLRLDTARLLEQVGVDMPTYSDPGAATRKAFDAVGSFRGYPTTFILDRNGVIRAVWTGFHSRAAAQMEEFVARLLNEQG